MNALAHIPPTVVCVSDYEPLAQERMSAETWAYFSSGACDEITLRENRAAFDRLKLNGRILTDFTGARTSLTLFGREHPHPIVLAPIAFQKLAHPDGELATVLAVAATGSTVVVSTQASVSLEDIAAKTPNAPRWFQLYLQPDRGFTTDLVSRVEQAGFEALVLTADAPINGIRFREQRAGFRIPPGIEAVNLRGISPPPSFSGPAGGSPLFGGPFADTAATWKDFSWLRSVTRLPILVKGTLSSADATHAIELGASGLIVSNHGGRTLDTAPASIEVLPKIADVVAGRVPLLLDGGIRRGTDIVKALALGASAVMIGRPYIHALAAAGAPGVAHVIQMLRAELEAAMVFTGCPTLAHITRNTLWRG